MRRTPTDSAHGAAGGHPSSGPVRPGDGRVATVGGDRASALRATVSPSIAADAPPIATGASSTATDGPAIAADTSTPVRPASFTEGLGVQGWRRLDAVLLASLAREMPLLLVGLHGTAKSLLAERAAAALGLSFRHYNASLLNYDDLVGIPMPDETGRSLRFVASPGAVWGAEFVLLDEISRCRADLQNKLFPLIHERRVAGVDLPRLRHRWAAMNPPPSVDGTPGADDYIGSEPLDPALADRFPFVVRVPAWSELDRSARRGVVLGGLVTDGGRASERIARAARLAESLGPALREHLADYVVTLVDRLDAARIHVSPRRARMLLEDMVALHAARIVLEGADAELAASAEASLLHGLPQTATAAPPEPATLIAAHRHAWEVTKLPHGSAKRLVLEEADPVRRVLLAAELGIGDAELSQLVTKCLSEIESPARRLGVATAMFCAFGRSRTLAPSAWEALAELVRRVLSPSTQNREISQGPRLETWREISQWIAQQSPTPTSSLEHNFLVAGFPDLWDAESWREAIVRFRADLAAFGVPERAEEAA